MQATTVLGDFDILRFAPVRAGANNPLSRFLMATIEKSINIDCPVHAVYHQWTQFEQFPDFMEGVKHVRKIDDKSMLWEVRIAGRAKIWAAEIFEQRRDERIAWHSVSGTVNSGMVSFEPLDPAHTRLTLRMKYKPQGILENIARYTGFVSACVTDDLKRFKEYIEYSHSAAERWCGEIGEGEVRQAQCC